MFVYVLSCFLYGFCLRPEKLLTTTTKSLYKYLVFNNKLDTSYRLKQILKLKFSMVIRKKTIFTNACSYIMFVYVSSNGGENRHKYINTNRERDYHNKPVPTIIATYPVRCLNTPGKSELMIFLTILATEPFRSELSSFTIRIRDTTINTREISKRSIPIVESDKSVLANKLSPIKIIAFLTNNRNCFKNRHSRWMKKKRKQTYLNSSRC